MVRFSWIIILVSGFSLDVVAKAGAGTKVVVFDLAFIGEVSEGVRAAARQRISTGLREAGLEVVHEGSTRPAAAGEAPCGRADCRRRAAGRLGCRYVVGGNLAVEDRSYRIELWLADGYSGNIIARVKQRCEICGLSAVAEKMELAASALRAKVATLARTPATIQILTDPPGAEILVDGDVTGPAPRELTLPEGEHRITARLPGHITAERSIAAVDGVHEKLVLKLIPSASGSRLGMIGWGAIGVGVAAVGVGVALFVIDGNGVGCPAAAVPNSQCSELRDTAAGAWTATAIGVGAAVTGAILLFRRYSARERAEVAPAALLSTTRRGLTLAW